MSTLADEFRSWVLHPSRTNDELFTAELMIEWGRLVWDGKHKNHEPTDWDARRKKQHARRLNPAYRPKIDRDLLEKTLEVWDAVKRLNTNYSEDRAVRDLTALHFFPHLEELEIHECEVEDLSVLQELRGLQKFLVREPNLDGGHRLQSLAGLAGLPALHLVSLAIRTPWPDLTALATLPALQTLTLHTNLLVLQDVGPLAKVEVATLQADFYCKTPLRSMRDVPEMPLLRQFVIDAVASLEGMERYTRLVNLEVEGYFRDLSPLATLGQVTSLKLKGSLFSDLAPLCRMAGLRRVELDREHPLDVSVLAEAPELREVKMPRCPMMATEVAALQAALVPWSVDFALYPPRVLEPLRFICYNHKDEQLEQASTAYRVREHQKYQQRVIGEDLAIRAAEVVWFEDQVLQRLDRLLGVGWGLPSHHHVEVRRYADVMRFREIVQVLREVSAIRQKPVRYLLIIRPHGDMSDDLERIRKRHGETTVDWLSRPYDAGEEKERWENFRKGRLEQREFLEREHRMRLRQQGGLEINPAEFAPNPEPPPKEKVTAGDVSDEDDDFDEEDTDDADEGGLMTPPPDDSTSELAEDLGFYAVLLENALLVSTRDKENAAYLMGEEPLEWEYLPEPVEERPLPDT